MGLFSSSRSSTTNQIRTQNAGFSEIGGPAVAIQGPGNRVTLTDQGALDLASDIASGAFEQVELAGSRAGRAVSDAVEAVAESNREETENVIGKVQTVIVIALLVWAVVAGAKVLKGG